MKPTIGRVVYLNHAGGVYAAIITFVHDDESIVDLHVMPSGTSYPLTDVPQGDQPGQWDWMPFQKDQKAGTK